MKPHAKMNVQPWMTAPETEAVLQALTAKGAVARFVGGCVRDAVLGRSVRDIDIATTEPPERVLELLKAAGIHAIPTGIAHGTVTAVVNHKLFEITTLRRDVETYGRHAKVRYTDDWKEDAARRDFTMNALFCDADGTLFDPFTGMADLREGRVRFVGEAKARIREDVLRLLRFFRFYAEYGKPPPDAEALRACTELAHLLPNLSGERVRAELLRLLDSERSPAVIGLMAQAGVLGHVLAEATEVETLAALINCETETVGGHAIRRLASLLKGEAAAVAVRLKLSNAEKHRLIGLVANPIDSGKCLDRKAVRAALYREGGVRVIDLALLHWARDGAGEAGYRAAIAEAQAWKPQTLPIKGKDLLALGLKPGPELGKLLEDVEAWWVGQDFAPSRAACLAQAKALKAR